jgi:hypothetical protein
MGLNRLVWDLRVQLPDAPASALPLPKAVPGKYTVRLTAGGPAQTASFNLLADPRTGVTQGDYQAQFDLLAAIAGGVVRIEKASAAIRSQNGTLAPELAALARELGAPGGGRGGRASTPPLLNQLTTLYEFVAGSEDKPTASAVSRWQTLEQRLDERLARVRALIQDERH